ncbi:MAG: hypothetical protein MUF54_25905 [Polyangiaceae bacterium]|nr:hypothetical protein [Polyangiaceae bacterium]
MAGLNFGRFGRVLRRSSELATQTGIKDIVVVAYNDMLEPSSDPYLALDAEVEKKEASWAKEEHEAVLALRRFDGEFQTARAAVLGFVTGAVVPDTLASQPTDTDKAHAVEHLLELIEDHKSDAWAQTLLAGTFGQQAPVVVKELHEAIDANKGLGNARSERAKAYGPTYERYIAFKRVVRAACGAHSKEYRRIHIRANGGIEDEVAPPVPAPPAA